MPTMIDEQHGSIDYEERGHGPTVVFVPGSCSTGAAWRPVISRLEDNYRCVTTSLLGYGGTTERRASLLTDISDEAEIVEAVVRRTGGPVHLVGHSFGGVAALAVALRNRLPLLSLVILEAPAVELLRHTKDWEHYCAFRDMTGNYFAAHYAGEPEAIASMIDFYGGPGTFASWPDRVRSYAVKTTPTNILDWADVYGFSLTATRLRAIDIPTLIVRGGASHPAMLRTNELLGRFIGGASVITVEGAAHFMINTHPDEVARIIARELDRSELHRQSIAA
jgi:pimeloyl-ACP methyl ester carboxylesterase